MARLIRIQRQRAAMADIAKRAAPRAEVAHDHKCGCAIAEALADVGAGRFLANSV